jgi:hypothetical protein
MDTAMMAGSVYGVLIGASVVDAVGKPVGRVRWADAQALTVDRGWLLPVQTQIPLNEVDRYQDGRLILKRTKAEVLGREA